VPRTERATQQPVPARAGSSVLWYRTPAATWNDALPIGSGRLGAMVFGRISEELVQLNEDTVWAGQKLDRINPASTKAIPEIRALLAAGKAAEAELLADKAVISIPRRMPPYQPLGDLSIAQSGVGDATQYRRELDIDSGIARVTFRANRTTYSRETFASAVDHVIAMRLTADGPGTIDLDATLRREADATASAFGTSALLLRGQALPHGERQAGEPKTGVRFTARLQAYADGAPVRVDGTSLRISGARSVTFFVAAATTMRSSGPDETCARTIAAAAARPWADLRASHVADVQRLMRRVSLTLDDGTPAPDLPTDERLARVQGGASDPALEALYFKFGRYLLLASSRPGSMPANLQGIWNDSLTPSWDSKYTININTEMNYWPSEVTNLSELQLPLFDLVEHAREDGRRVARTMYGAGGFVIHHNTDLWGHAVPIDQPRSGLWPMGGAWLSLHFWDHYDYTGDRTFLAERAYPAMKEAVEFLLDYMVVDAKGQLITGPSVSPENRYRLPDGTVAALCMGPYMDSEIAYALFGRLIDASRILGRDPEFAERVATARSRLPALRIGKHGQLQEWLEDYDEAEPGHRHISHLFALHPGNQITLRGTPELARAARISLERRLSAGSGHTGWSRAWIINFWARLEEAELAHENLIALLAKSTLPNLLDTHPPFQIDGNFGGTAAIVEMLMQSHAGEIALLPALPRAWPSGSVTGVRARGAIELDIRWRDRKATEVVLRPLADGEHVLRPPKGQTVAAVTDPDGGHPIAVRPAGDSTVRLQLLAAHHYRVTFR
jgi:alpha-L-fucosidase 2